MHIIYAIHDVECILYNVKYAFTQITLRNPSRPPPSSAAACRPSRSSVATLYDVHTSIPEFGSASSLGEVVRGRLGDLPEAIRFRTAIPASAKVEECVSTSAADVYEDLQEIWNMLPFEEVNLKVQRVSH